MNFLKGTGGSSCVMTSQQGQLRDRRMNGTLLGRREHRLVQNAVTVDETMNMTLEFDLDAKFISDWSH